MSNTTLKVEFQGDKFKKTIPLDLLLSIMTSMDRALKECYGEDVELQISELMGTGNGGAMYIFIGNFDPDDERLPEGIFTPSSTLDGKPFLPQQSPGKATMDEGLKSERAKAGFKPKPVCEGST